MSLVFFWLTTLNPKKEFRHRSCHVASPRYGVLLTELFTLLKERGDDIRVSNVGNTLKCSVNSSRLTFTGNNHSGNCHCHVGFKGDGHVCSGENVVCMGNFYLIVEGIGDSLRV